MSTTNNKHISFKILLYFALFSAGVILSGCQTTNIKQDYSFDEKADTALIIGSVTQTENAGLPTNAEFYIDYNGKYQKQLFAKQKTTLGYLGVVNEFENTGVAGRIFVIELPAGQHVMNHWRIEYGDGSGFILYPKVPPPTLTFSLEARQIVYLGNFHMEIKTGKGWLGQTLPTTGIPIINDEHERDIKFFKERYPQFASREIIINVIHSGPWVSESQLDEELSIPKAE